MRSSLSNRLRENFALHFHSQFAPPRLVARVFERLRDERSGQRLSPSLERSQVVGRRITEQRV